MEREREGERERERERADYLRRPKKFPSIWSLRHPENEPIKMSQKTVVGEGEGEGG